MCDSRGGVSFDPKEIIRIESIKVHKEMLNIKYQSFPVSEKMNFEVGVLCSYVPTYEARGGASFDPQDIIWTNLVDVHTEMLTT